MVYVCAIINGVGDGTGISAIKTELEIHISWFLGLGVNFSRKRHQPLVARVSLYFLRYC